MSRLVRFEPVALLEVSNAANWYEDRRSGLGSDFLSAVDGTTRRIAQQRILGLRLPALAHSSTVRRVAVPRFPYQIVFQVVDDNVRVLAVAHDHQRPRYWADRVEIEGPCVMEDPTYDLWYNATTVGADLVVETWISHGPHASDTEFNPRAGDWVIVGDEDEPPIRGRVTHRSASSVWVQLGLGLISTGS